MIFGVQMTGMTCMSLNHVCVGDSDSVICCVCGIAMTHGVCDVYMSL